MTKVGILGGTFDPVHWGHLIVAEQARVTLGLGKIIFIPTGRPWIKAQSRITSRDHRFKMVQAALVGYPHFEMSSIEIDKSGNSYTVDTLEDLSNQMDAKSEVFFLLGRDAAENLHVWKRPCRILELCTLVIMSRPGAKRAGLTTLKECPNHMHKIIEISVPPIDISGTEIRSNVAQGRSIHYLVPPVIRRYIQNKSLYIP